MQIAIGSIFRNAEYYIYRYMQQIWRLRELEPRHMFRIVLCEGDSTDGTFELLDALAFDAVTKRAHGGPLFGSVDNKERWTNISWTWEGVLERLLPADDVFILVDSDLIWEPETMLRLVGHLQKPDVDMVAPMCFRQGYHYDTWGLRGTDGSGYGAWPPYHRELSEPPRPNGLYRIRSAGACMVMHGKVARTCHFTPADMANVGFCWNMAENGYQLWLDPTLRVHHS
jgi:GT2 family glycosyltransferase